VGYICVLLWNLPGMTEQNIVRLLHIFSCEHILRNTTSGAKAYEFCSGGRRDLVRASAGADSPEVL
jgi:hypothetical protein